jgi:hypothetical protein
MEIFVACPYRVFPIDDYKAVFRRVSRSYNVSFKFADEQITSQHILEKIAGYIRECDFSLFDVTSWNPNVSLELGIAVGSSKKYFILFNASIDSNSDVPSDIRGFDRIQYSSNTELEAKLNLLLKQQLPKRPQTTDLTFDDLKAKIAENLAQSPGLGLAQLAKVLSTDKLIVSSMLKSMVNNAELKVSGKKRGTVYFIDNSEPLNRN